MQLKRREFLGSVLAGTALAGAGPNDRIRAAVIGVGWRGRDHMLILGRTPGVEVATFCDTDETRMAERAQEFEKTYNKRPKLETDLRRVLDDKDIDVVTVATPNHWHALSTIWACQAGKHVYVEKPLAHDVFEGKQMVAAARRYNRIVQGGTQRRSMGTVRKGIQVLREGAIGEVYMARCIHFQPRESLGFKPNEAPPPTLKWDLWLGPAPEQPFHRNLVHYNWHWFWDFGNGELANNGVHYMDVARWGLNKIAPVRIHSTGGRFGYRDQGQTPNTQMATYEFDDGKQLVCEIRGRFSNSEMEARSAVFFYGSDGYMVFDRDDVSLYKGKNAKPEPALGKLDDVDHFEKGRDAHFENFFAAVRAGDRSILTADVEETYRSTMFPLLGNISYKLKREVRFDPQTWKCTGDEEANRMLASTYRKPFVVPEKV